MQVGRSNKLPRCFRLCKALDEEFVFMKALARLSAQFPVACVECLQLLVAKVSPERSFWLDRGELQLVLKAAVSSGQQRAVEVAGSVRDALLARGHFGLAKLDQGSA